MNYLEKVHSYQGGRPGEPCQAFQPITFFGAFLGSAGLEWAQWPSGQWPSGTVNISGHLPCWDLYVWLSTAVIVRVVLPTGRSGGATL